MTTPIPGVVFDCVVLLQAAISNKGPAFACKELVDAGKVVAFLSPEVLAELNDVLNRPELRKKFKTLTAKRAEAYLRDLTGKATMVEEVPARFRYERDPNDESYVNLALVAGAAYLVSWDKDLLDLMNEEMPDGKAFRERFPGVAILSPVAFLGVMRPKLQEQKEPERKEAGPSDEAASGNR
jgi:putative PIN family toxin of toxin-antitoxin system